MKKNNITHYCYLDSPLGKLMLAGDEHFLKLIEFPGQQNTNETKKIGYIQFLVLSMKTMS